MNDSGIAPVGHNVIVRPKPVEERTKGGVILPDEKQDRDGFARTEGTIVAISPLAFRWQDWPEGATWPQVGSRVFFSRYQAETIKGADGEDYWIMKDESIAGVLQ